MIVAVVTLANNSGIEVQAADTWIYGVSNKTEVFTAPQTGLYRIDTMGATGYNRENGHADDGSPGFANYEIVLKQGEQLFITVGGKGKLSTGGTVAGGYNGGGSASGSGNGSGGGATLVAFKSGTIAELAESDILSVAGGSGGMSSYEPNYWGECVNIGGQGGGYYGGSRDYAAGGSQTSGYSKLQGQNGVNCGGGGGGYYGGFSSGSAKWGAGGGSGYLNTNRLTYQAWGSLVDVRDSNGYVNIKFIGEAKSTVTIDLGGNGTIDGQSKVTYTGTYGDTITLPTPTLKYDFVTFKGYKNISTGNCGTLNGLQFTFGIDKTFIGAEYGGTKATLETTQEGNKVHAKVTFASAEYNVFNLMGGKSPNNLTDVLTSFTAVPLDAFKNSMTASLTGYKTQTVNVNFNGYYDITMRSAGGGKDQQKGGSGATLGLRVYLYAGDVVTLYGSSAGADHASGRKTDPGGSGIASGGNGYASGGGGGASGFKLNGSIAAAAGAGGGDNWAAGQGGRVYGSRGNTNGSSMNGQNGHCINSSGADAADTGGGGAGWYGGAEGTGDGGRGGFGGISGFNSTLLRNPTVIQNTGGSTGGGRHDGTITMVPYSFDVPSGLSGSGDTYTVTIKDTVAPDSPINSRIDSFSSTGYRIQLEKTKDYGGSYYMQIPGYTDVKDFYYTSGFNGWRYVINEQSSYTITGTDTFTSTQLLNIDVANEGKYLHVAAVDKDGNISTTFTIRLPKSVWVTYDTNKTQHNPSTTTYGAQSSERIFENYAIVISDSKRSDNGQIPLSRVGYTCTNWNTKADGTGTDFQFNQLADYSELEALGNNITLYAQWTPHKYTVNIYKNKPIDATSEVIYKGGADWNNNEEYYSKVFTFDVTTLPVTSEKYSLLGWTIHTNWFKELNGNNGGVTGTNYAAGTDNLSSVDGDTVNLYAGWSKNKYTIIYSGNDTVLNIYGDTVTSQFTGNTPSTICYYDTNVTLETNRFSKTGYKFKCWNTKSDGSGTSYSSGQTLTKPNFVSTNNGTITLYAIWEPITYTINFNGNNNWNTSQGMYTSTDLLGHKLRYDEPIKLTNRFNRIAPYVDSEGKTHNESWTFRGWTIGSDVITFASQTVAPYTDCSVNNNNVARAYNFTVVEGDTVNLYASWQRGINLQFNLNGGEYNGNTGTVILSSTLYNNQMEYTFSINNSLTSAKEHFYDIQTNKIDAYGTYDNYGINSKYTKVNSGGTIYRFLGWSTDKNADIPDTGLDIINSPLSTHAIYNNTVLYAVWEEVIEIDIKWLRPLGTLKFEDGTLPIRSLEDIRHNFSNIYNIEIVARPSEFIRYDIKSTSDKTNTIVTFDTRITDIYTHGDSTSTWYDTLNKSTNEDLLVDQGHGLNRKIMNNGDVTRIFYIPQYLGTEWSYDTSNPTKTSNTEVYNVTFDITQDSHFFLSKYGTPERVFVTGTIYLVDDTNDEYVDNIFEEFKTTLR